MITDCGVPSVEEVEQEILDERMIELVRARRDYLAARLKIENRAIRRLNYLQRRIDREIDENQDEGPAVDGAR